MVQVPLSWRLAVVALAELREGLLGGVLLLLFAHLDLAATVAVAVGRLLVGRDRLPCELDLRRPLVRLELDQVGRREDGAGHLGLAERLLGFADPLHGDVLGLQLPVLLLELLDLRRGLLDLDVLLCHAGLLGFQVALQAGHRLLVGRRLAGCFDRLGRDQLHALGREDHVVLVALGALEPHARLVLFLVVLLVVHLVLVTVVLVGDVGHVLVEVVPVVHPEVRVVVSLGALGAFLFAGHGLLFALPLVALGGLFLAGLLALDPRLFLFALSALGAFGLEVGVHVLRLDRLVGR